MSVTQSWPTLCDSMNYSSPSSSVHGILQARILEWVAIPFSRDHYLMNICCVGHFGRSNKLKHRAVTLRNKYNLAQEIEFIERC